MYGIKVITTDFVADIKRFAKNRTEETTYSINLTVTNVFIQAKETTGSCAIGSIAIIHVYYTDETVFHLPYTSKALLQLTDSE